MKGKLFPKWVGEQLASCPQTGAGVHRWLFVTALKLHPYLNDKDELARLLEEATAHCGRDVPYSEIADAVRNSQRLSESPIEPRLAAPRWPRCNTEQIEAVVRAGPTLAELGEMSPIKFADNRPHTEEIIDVLFPGNPLLCAAPAQYDSHTQRKILWRGMLAKQQFLVPNPMSAPYGETKSAGKKSMRTLANTGPRRFIVVEFDKGTFDQHAAVLWHLAKYAPLVMVVHSGNKSCHGWFFCAGAPEPTVEKFFRYAVSLGADPATWTRCQLVRMPDGRRENGKRQQVVFFNPKPLEGK